jgi:beta-glucanase (GH16 family)
MKSILRLAPALLLLGASFCAYQLLHPKFTEDFNHYRIGAWSRLTKRFPGNGANMLEKMVAVKDSTLIITLDANESPGIDAQQYSSGGVESEAMFNSGIISFRLKNKLAPGTVGTFSLVSQRKPGNNEQKQISFTFMGAKKDEVILSTQYRKNSKGKPENFGYYSSCEFSPSTGGDYHDYAIEWSGNDVVFYVDGQEEFATDSINFDEPMKIEIMQWTANKDENPGAYTWMGGPVENKSLPSRIYCQMINVRRVTIVDASNPFKF